MISVIVIYSGHNEGQTHLTVSEKPSTPNLEMQYAAEPGKPTRPAMLDVLTILPLVIFNRGKKILVTSAMPKMLTSQQW